MSAIGTANWLRWSLILALPIMLVVWVRYVEDDAQANARAFCQRFPVGSSIADVATAAAETGDDRHRIVSADQVVIAFIGVPPFSRHVCIHEGRSGEVTSTRYLHVD